MATISSRVAPSPKARKPAEQEHSHFSNDAPVQHGGFGKTLRIFWNMRSEERRVGKECV